MESNTYVQEVSNLCGVAFHRRDMGKHSRPIPESVSACHQCGCDLADSTSTLITSYDRQASVWLDRLCRQLVPNSVNENEVDLGTMGVLRQFGKLMVSQYSTIKLHGHICSMLGVQEMPLSGGRLAFELRPLPERHHLMQLLGWLMSDLEPRLRVAWRAKAVRYNHLCKDFDDAPEWFLVIAGGFSDWRRS